MLYFISIYFIITIFVATSLFTYVYMNTNSKRIFLVLCLILSVLIYVSGYLFEIHSNSMNEAIFWNYFQYLTIPVISTLWLIVTLAYNGILEEINSVKVYVLFIVPLITYIMRFSNDLHHLYYTDMSFSFSQGLAMVKLSYGPWYYVHIIYSALGLLAVISVFVFKGLLNKTELSAKKHIEMITITSISLITIALTIVKPFGAPIDYYAILLPIPIISISYLVIKEDYFEVNLLARNEIFNKGEDGVLILNDHGLIIDFNKAAANIFFQNGIILDNRELLHFSPFNEELIGKVASDQKSIYETTVDENPVYYEITSVEMINKHGKHKGCIKTLRNITEEYKLQNHLKHVAMIDDLSQLYNRREFILQANEMISESIGGVALLMADIDSFKQVNDTFGHQVGDDVIKGFGKVLKNSFRGGDIIARFGGEEFVVMMSNIEVERVVERANVFRKQIEMSSFIEDDSTYVITVSVGASIIKDNESLDELIYQADKALYRSKSTGKNKVTVYGQAL